MVVNQINNMPIYETSNIEQVNNNHENQEKTEKKMKRKRKREILSKYKSNILMEAFYKAIEKNYFNVVEEEKMEGLNVPTILLISQKKKFIRLYNVCCKRDGYKEVKIWSNLYRNINRNVGGEKYVRSDKDFLYLSQEFKKDYLNYLKTIQQQNNNTTVNVNVNVNKLN